MDRISLNGKWSGCCLLGNQEPDFTFEGDVPGCVHTDLMGSHIPEDLYLRNNADQVQWIEERDWLYARSFQLEQLPSRCKLVFEGLDTYAQITLNGTVLGCADNMFIRHSFDVSAILKKGENRLEVLFYSPIRMVQGLERRKAAFTAERLHTRRIQCTYGWDWVGRFVTCGIFREVYLEPINMVDIDAVYIFTNRINGSSANIGINITAETEYDLQIMDPEDNCIYQNSFTGSQELEIDIPNARLWYPVGYGAQPLYNLKIGNKTYPFGIRLVEIRQTEDAPDSDYHKKCLQLQESKSGSIYDHNTTFAGFELLINGVKILCKGANWVPCEPFPSAETDEKISYLLNLAKEAGVNMLRVWGGGIFEKEHFYNTCDRLGILVTQDFLMACGHYPEDEPGFIKQLNKEAEYAALTLRNHPCLVWWSGDNENAVRGAEDATDYTGYKAIHQGLLPVMRQLDPYRTFLLSSPYGGNMFASKTRGTTHNTQFMGCSLFPYVRDTDMTDYKEHLCTYLARFIAEEPSFGAVCLPSLRRFMNDNDIFSSKEMWQYHTKSNPALKFTLYDFAVDFASKVLGTFRDGADRFFKLKYIQYEWVRVTMENFRRNEGFINGMIYWMWNDCWPAAAGWAFVDYYGLPKASYYSFKRCAGPLLVSIEKDIDYRIQLCSGKCDAELTLYTADKSGVRKLKTGTISSAQVLPEKMVPQGNLLICDVRSGTLSDRAFYKDGALPIVPCKPPKVLSRTATAITLAADSYIHAVELEGEYIFCDNFFSMLPGEIRTIDYKPSFCQTSDHLTINSYTILWEE